MTAGKSHMSFAQKKVSINAVVATILGVLLNITHVGMMAYSIREQGNVPFGGGVTEIYILLFSIFGICWATLSFDDEKTTNKYKFLGVILNGISLTLSIFILVLGLTGML